jgi:hypothetical protein
MDSDLEVALKAVTQTFVNQDIPEDIEVFPEFDEDHEPTSEERSDPESPYYHGDSAEHSVWHKGGVL